MTGTLDPRRDFDEALRRSLAPESVARVLDALAFAIERSVGRTRASGEPAWMHELRVASILLEMGMDADSVIAGLLHDLGERDEGEAERPGHKAEAGEASAPVHAPAPARKPAKGKAVRMEAPGPGSELAARVGADVARIVDGSSRLSALRARNKSVHAAEGIRKMLFAMTSDIRVIIVKLADKLDSMRTLRWLPEARQKEIATECLDVFAPLADRLGVSGIKDELEDLALKHINREAFEQIKVIVSEKREERERFLSRVEKTIAEAATSDGVDVEVHARAKHFYSIYLKMRKRAKGAEDLFDLFGVRLLCATDTECYALLGLVHRLWKPIEGRFKDYIAMPKSNGYRSLHTTVMCFDGRLLEVQIRTREMHGIAEFGVASHWLYKKGPTAELPKSEELGLVNRMREWSSFIHSGPEFLEGIKRELLRDSIFVFTPLGDVIELPAGASPLDFAFAIHSDIGMRCIGAKADGMIVPLDGELRNTQVVEILTSTQAHPTMNWLSLAKTSKARSKIKSWLVQSGQVLAIEKNIVAGRKGGPEKGSEKGPEKGTVAHGDSHGQAPAAHGSQEKKPEVAIFQASRPEDATLEFRSYQPGEELRNERAGVAIGGERGLVIRIAGCCRPVTGDPIVGYVSRGRGIIVHRAQCKTLSAIPDFTDRRIEVSWEAQTPFVSARFRLTARKSPDLFSEIEGAVRKFRGHLREGKLGERGDGAWEGAFTMEVERREDIDRVLKSVRGIPSVLTIERT
jgi:GTP pyrophosphokinase